eukprot:6467346-Prymnesium_polylepis.1
MRPSQPLSDVASRSAADAASAAALAASQRPGRVCVHAHTRSRTTGSHALGAPKANDNRNSVIRPAGPRSLHAPEPALLSCFACRLRCDMPPVVAACRTIRYEWRTHLSDAQRPVAHRAQR